MRVVQLAQVAARAEAVRVRAMLRRVMGNAVIGVIALLFLFSALGFGHLAVWHALREGLGWSNAVTAAVVAGGDLVLAGLLAMGAARSTPSRVETEALAVRQRATDGIAASANLTTMTLAVLRRWLQSGGDSPRKDGSR
jgi:hypothetical protein